MRLILITFLCFTAFSLQAGMSTQQRAALKEYYDSGRYFKEVERKISDATEYLDRQRQYAKEQRLAIVLDIDETALSNYRSLERMFFTSNVQALTGAYMLGGAEAIPPILALYQHAIANNIAVFFISGRPNSLEIAAATVKNLKSAGYDRWQEIILKPLENDTLSEQEFKTDARRRITAEGYMIVLNVGDEDADLNGGYAEVKVKIPNPFYD